MGLIPEKQLFRKKNQLKLEDLLNPKIQKDEAQELKD